MDKLKVSEALRVAYSSALERRDSAQALVLEQALRELQCRDYVDTAMWAVEKLEHGDTLEVGERLAIRRVVTEGAELIRVFQALTEEID